MDILQWTSRSVSQLCRIVLYLWTYVNSTRKKNILESLNLNLSRAEERYRFQLTLRKEWRSLLHRQPGCQPGHGGWRAESEKTGQNIHKILLQWYVSQTEWFENNSVLNYICPSFSRWAARLMVVKAMVWMSAADTSTSTCEWVSVYRPVQSVQRHPTAEYTNIGIIYTSQVWAWDSSVMVTIISLLSESGDSLDKAGVWVCDFSWQWGRRGVYSPQSWGLSLRRTEKLSSQRGTVCWVTCQLGGQWGTVRGQLTSKC